MKKKRTILLCAVAVAVAAVVGIISHIRGAPEPPGGASSRYNTVDFVTTDFHVDGDGEALLTIHAKGLSDRTTFHIASYIERDAGEGRWERVDNGQAEYTWADVVSGLNCSVIHTVYIGRNAECRAVVYFRITGEGEEYSDTITVYTTQE